MHLRNLIIPCLALFTFPACSDSGGDSSASGGAGGQSASADGGGGGGSGGGGDTCPLVALSCPSGCDGIDAMILQHNDTCISRAVRLGCWDPAVSATNGAACVKDATTGDIYQLGSPDHADALAATEDYEACSDAEATTAADAEQCVHTFGADGGLCPLGRDITCPTGCVAFNGRAYDSANQCMKAETQLGCYSETGVITKNGGCVQDAVTDEVWIVSSGAYAQQLLVSGDYVACGLDAMSISSPPDCP